MTVTPSICPVRLIEEQLSQTFPDLLRELLTVFQKHPHERGD